jgi:hypothetical protein
MSGGLRDFNPDIMQDYEPMSIATISMLAHNQDLIQRTLAPKTIINQFIPRDGSGYGRFYDTAGSGYLIAMWGPFRYQPTTEIRVKVFAKRLTGTYSANTDLYFFSYPNLPMEVPADLDDLLDKKVELKLTISSTSGAWVSGVLDPEPGKKKMYYISLWGRPSDETGSEADLVNICARERVT